MATTEKTIADLATMRSLAVKLIDEGNKIEELLQSTSADIKALDASWVGSNHDRFNTYFDELYDDAMFFHGYVRFFGEIMRDAVTVYERLMDDVDARMSNALNGCSS